MATTDEDLNQLEKDVRQLKIEYEQYFGGGRARPPTDIEWRIDLILKRHSDRTAEMNFSQRFRYSNLAQTNAKYREIFRKRLKQKEEGIVPRHFGAAARAIEAERARTRKAREASQAGGTIYAVVCSDPTREAKKVEDLYKAFSAAIKESDEQPDEMTLAAFRDFIRDKTAQLRKQKGCRQVEFLVTLERGEAKLKARVKK